LLSNSISATARAGPSAGPWRFIDRASSPAPGLISWRRVRAAAAEALAIMGSDLDPDAPISSLPAAERSLVAIGRALAIKSDIVVLDEPTAALPEADVERLLETLRRLRANDIGVVFATPETKSPAPPVLHARRPTSTTSWATRALAPQRPEQ